jgi:hypothetical protein
LKPITRARVFRWGEFLADSFTERLAAFAYPGRDRPLPPVLLVALPKSGSIYLQRALRRTLRVQIHHIGASGMSGSTFNHYGLLRFERGNVVSREHLQPRACLLSMLARHGVRKAVLHLRDPRAAIVSWTRHMDRIMEKRGLRSVELSCERTMPDAYANWSFAERLDWQVEHMMPMFVRWVEDWLELVAASRDVEFLVTEYRALCDDGRGLVMRILDFYGIAYEPDWISMPVIRIGKNNIYTLPERTPPRELPPGGLPSGETVRAAWMNAMPAETLQAANALLPAALSNRFDWVKA